MKLKDKVAVVTGAGGGLGEGICLCLAMAGAHVVTSDLRLDSAEKVAAKVRELGRRSLSVKTDVRIPDECDNLIDTSIKEMNKIDILVCNAGVSGFSNWDDSDMSIGLESISEADWNLAVDVNLKGVFLSNKAITPYFKKQRSGKIINISSNSGRIGSDWLPHYSATKAGVIVLTQGIALLLASYNVNVNTVCPGAIWTDMWEEGAKVLSRSYAPYRGMKPEEIFKKRIEQIPLGRAQTPEDIGNLVVFLASEESKEITGQAINVDGGTVLS